MSLLEQCLFSCRSCCTTSRTLRSTFRREVWWSLWSRERTSEPTGTA
uniref:Uncharacterized protein n=1 Tax=Arundo donax TaxID=35708 RepID=A0A0A9BTE5_ARUDO